MAQKSIDLRDEIRDLLNGYRGHKLHGRCIWAVMKRVEILRKRAMAKKKPSLQLVKGRKTG